MLPKHSDNFRQFVEAMDTILRTTEKVDGRDQRKLLEDLIALETKFRKRLLSTKHGGKLYREFMDFILKKGRHTPKENESNYIPDDKADMMEFQDVVSQESRNILRARVYFRERQDMFSESIAKAFHRNRSSMLHKFKVNYEFVMWTMENYHGPNRRVLATLTKHIIKTRKILCENNLPLAINRAKIFWSSVPETHLEYMDLIQTSSEGLITAIDKFVPPYKTVFRTTAIGRMTLNMSTDHSATLVKLSPRDKRILYRARKARGKEKLTNENEILAYVQQSFKNVTKEYLNEILAAAQGAVDIDHKAEDSHPLSEKIPDIGVPVDEQAASGELREKLSDGLFTLVTRERKIVCLKNGDL